jgi:hypothetical protein
MDLLPLKSATQRMLNSIHVAGNKIKIEEKTGPIHYSPLTTHHQITNPFGITAPFFITTIPSFIPYSE